MYMYVFMYLYLYVCVSVCMCSYLSQHIPTKLEGHGTVIFGLPTSYRIQRQSLSEFFFFERVNSTSPDWVFQVAYSRDAVLEAMILVSKAPESTLLYWFWS